MKRLIYILLLLFPVVASAQLVAEYNFLAVTTAPGDGDYGMNGFFLDSDGRGVTVADVKVDTTYFFDTSGRKFIVRSKSGSSPFALGVDAVGHANSPTTGIGQLSDLTSNGLPFYSGGISDKVSSIVNNTSVATIDALLSQRATISQVKDTIYSKETISQASHGFSVGDPLWYSGDYILARDTGESVRVDGIVTDSVDANNFVWQRTGKFTLAEHGFTANIQLYVQADGSYGFTPGDNVLAYGYAVNSNEIEIGVKSEAIRYLSKTDSSVFSTRNYTDRLDRLKANFKASIESPRYKSNDIIKLRDNNAEFQILRTISSSDVVDSIFITEVYDTSLTSENLFLLSEDFARPFPYPWRPSGSGTDIAFEKDVMLSPLGTFTADKSTKTVSSFVRQYMQDTIFANTTYYLSFWFRAGDGMPASGVEMDEIRFLNNGANYTDPVTIPLTTTDTLWRYYEIAMEQSDIDLLPTGATGADWGCRFDGMPNPSEFSIWGISLSRNQNEQYIRTTDTKTAKRYRGYSKLLTQSQVLELDKFPEYIGITDAQILKNGTERLQAAYDYCAAGNCDYIDIGRGLTIDSAINVRDGVVLISKWSGDTDLDDQDPRITVDLNDSLATAFTVMPDSGNPIPLGAGFKNIYFDVVSPVNIVIDMGSSNKSTLENVAVQGNKLSKTNLRYGREEYIPGERYGAIGNTNRNVRLFEATEQAMLLDSIGALNFFYESQFHRSKIGIKAENSNLNCYGCHIEKSDSLALVFNEGLLYWHGGYTESPNFDPGLGGGEVGDTIAFHIKKARIAEFKNSIFSTSSETLVYFKIDSDVDEFVLDHNYFSGGTLDRFIDIGKPTRFYNDGNVFFAPGAMANTIPPNQTSDMQTEYPVLIEGLADKVTNQNIVLKDSIAFSSSVLRSKVNHVADSEEIANNSTYTYNTGRITVAANDLENPIDSLVTAERLTLTAVTEAKLLNITATGLTLEAYTRYNLSFWIRPGTESFNDNIAITLTGDLIQADTIKSFDPSLKEWQRIDTMIVFTEAPVSNQVSVRFHGDASDYLWLTGVQITQGETVVDYVKTTGSTASGDIKTKIGDGTEVWQIEGGLSLTEDLIVAGSLTAEKYHTFQAVQYNALDTITVDTLNTAFAITPDLNGLDVKNVTYTTNANVSANTTVRLLYYDVSADTYTAFGSGTILSGTNQIQVTGLTQTVAAGDWIYAEATASGGEANGLSVNLRFQ